MLGVRLRLATHLPPSERPTPDSNPNPNPNPNPNTHLPPSERPMPPLRQDAALPRSTVALTLAKHVTPRSGRASWLVHAW